MRPLALDHHGVPDPVVNASCRPVNMIREVNRGGKGVRLVTLAEGDKLLSIARIVETDEEQAANSTPPMETPPATA